MRPWVRLSLVLAVGIGIVAAVYAVVDRIDHQPEPSLEAFCEQVGQLSALDQALGDLDTARVLAAIPVLEELERVAPTTIAAEVTVLRETVTALADTMREAPSGDTDALRAAWRARQGSVSEIQTSSAAVVTFTESNCGIDLDGTGTTVGTIDSLTPAGGPGSGPSTDP